MQPNMLQKKLKIKEIKILEMIKDLFINYVGFGDVTRKDYLLKDRIDATTKELQRNLNNKNRKKLDRISNDYQEINLIETEESFARGFAFAVQLLSEAFAQKL